MPSRGIDLATGFNLIKTVSEYLKQKTNIFNIFVILNHKTENFKNDCKFGKMQKDDNLIFSQSY